MRHGFGIKQFLMVPLKIVASFLCVNMQRPCVCWDGMRYMRIPLKCEVRWNPADSSKSRQNEFQCAFSVELSVELKEVEIRPTYFLQPGSTRACSGGHFACNASASVTWTLRLNTSAVLHRSDITEQAFHRGGTADRAGVKCTAGAVHSDRSGNSYA